MIRIFQPISKSYLSWKNAGIQVIVGSHPLALLDEAELIVKENPGIPYTNPLIAEAQNRGF